MTCFITSKSPSFCRIPCTTERGTNHCNSRFHPDCFVTSLYAQADHPCIGCSQKSHKTTLLTITVSAVPDWGSSEVVFPVCSCQVLSASVPFSVHSQTATLLFNALSESTVFSITQLFQKSTRKFVLPFVICILSVLCLLGNYEKIESNALHQNFCLDQKSFAIVYYVFPDRWHLNSCQHLFDCFPIHLFHQCIVFRTHACQIFHHHTGIHFQYPNAVHSPDYIK